MNSHEMFGASSKTAVSHPMSSLDNPRMNALGVWPDGKPRLQWYGRSMMEPSFPRHSDAKAENDSLRRKLRDSLTSALEMVVSKQLVKSVLGKTVEFEVAEVMQSQCKTEIYGTSDRSTDDSAALKLSDGEVQSLDHRSDSNNFVDKRAGCAKVSDSQGCLFMVSTAAHSDRCDYRSEVDGATVGVVEEAKGGIQLMEQARNVAWNVESNLFSLNGGVNKKYKEKARSLLFNLKDKSNPELRARVFKGEINPAILVSMSAAELASKELCQWRIAKAEEFASMVVLTEADMDHRRIVKKTHKGEFQVVVDDVGVSAGAESNAVRSAYPANATGGTRGDAVSGRIGKGGALREVLNNSSVEDCEVDPHSLSHICFSHEIVENESRDMNEPADDLINEVPSMTSTDEGVIRDRESEINETSHTNVSVRDGGMKTVLALHSDSSGDEIWTDVLPILSDCGTTKLCRGADTSFFDSESGDGLCFSKSSVGQSLSSVWEGSLQLSATRSVFIGAFYKRGVRLELKDWPRSVEVKGRVKLGVFDKFLRDLQLSRSRTVTVLSLCPSDGQGDAKRMGVYLKEIADHYRMGDRAGFAEPKPGFELYLLAPGSACLDLLIEEQKTTNVALKTEDEVLVGVVVWRKVLSQGLSSNRGPKRSCNVRKVASSNLLFDSPTTSNAQALHGKETASFREGVSTSVGTVSGDTSMHSTKSVGGSSNTWDHELVSPAPIGLRHPSLVAPLNRVAEDAHCSMTDSCLLPQLPCDREDLPPGFIFQTKAPVTEGGPAVFNVRMEQHVQNSQGSPSLAGGVSGSLVRNGNREVSTEAPPGFWSKSPTQFPTRAIQKLSTALQQDDDDLPEFNFDAEGETHENPGSQVSLACRTVFLAPHNRNGVPHPVTELQHINGPSNRYQVHHDVCIYKPSSMDLHSMLNGPPSRNISQQEGSTASQSVSSFPSRENWNNGVLSKEIVSRVTQQNIYRSILLSNGMDDRNLTRVVNEDLSRCEKLMDNGPHASGVFGHSTSMPSTFTSSRAKLLHIASHTSRSNGLLPRNCPPPFITQLGQHSPSPTLSGYSEHSGQQTPFFTMVMQHRQKETKTSVLSSVGEMLLPYQEVRRHEWQAIGANVLQELCPSDSKHVYPRSKRNMEATERMFKKVRESEFTGKDARQSEDQPRPGEFCREPSLASTTEKALERLDGRSVCPGRGTSLLSGVQGGTKPSKDFHEAKIPKRKRERDQ